MRKRIILLTTAILLLVVVAELFFSGRLRLSLADRLHFEREETELVVTNAAGASVRLFRAGPSLNEAAEIPAFDGQRQWLARGGYFVQAVA